MAKHPRTLGRAYLAGKLRERGLPRRQAVAVVNAILEGMIKALRRGEDVPFPFGKLKCVRRHFSEYWDSVDDWPANREGYTVEWPNIHFATWVDMPQRVSQLHVRDADISAMWIAAAKCVQWRPWSLAGC